MIATAAQHDVYRAIAIVVLVAALMVIAALREQP